MGVPVITMTGYNFNSRCGESIIKNLGIENLIANNEDDYILKAQKMAKDNEKLLELSESLNVKNLDWILSYQSRVGPLKWIGPSTEDIIVENSKLGKHIVLVPIAFVVNN